MAPAKVMFAFSALASAEKADVCEGATCEQDQDSSTLLQVANVARRSKMVQDPTAAPPGWLQHNVNWNCGGSGQDNSEVQHNGVGSIEECSDLCAQDGHEVAALWGDGREICRCYADCEGGGATHVPDWTNVVVRQDSAPPRWSEINQNWNCEGRGSGNAEEHHNVANLADCAAACGDFEFAALWWNNKEVCRCYHSCEDGGATYLPEWPNTVMTQELVPEGWVHHNTNWNCGGRGAGNHEEQHAVGTLADCAEQCSGFQFAALWWNNRNICRCYNSCEGGGATHMPEYPNTVMAQEGAPEGWTEVRQNWNCGGRGAGNHLAQHTVGSLADCAQACSEGGYLFAAQWWNGREICRCYNECDGGGNTHMPSYPNTVMAAPHPVPPELCRDGIISNSGLACCAASCGTCGGAGCGSREGGKALCCHQHITGQFNDGSTRDFTVCEAEGDVGCAIP